MRLQQAMADDLTATVKIVGPEGMGARGLWAI